jgi:WD40-like Beta Propeller Repeat
MAFARVIAVALLVLAAAGCGAAERASAPRGPTGELRVREIHVTGAPYFVEGAITYVRAGGEEHTLQPPDDLRLELPVGTQQIEIWHRPCDGNCSNLDPPTDRCSASVDVRDSETALATISEYPGRPCEFALGRVGIAYAKTDARDINGRRSAVWFAQPDGTRPVRLAEASTVPPALSPDGTRIAFVGFTPQPRSAAIFVVPTTGGNPVLVRRVKEPNAFIGGLVWSPDGSRLLSSEGSGLFLLRARAPAHPRFVGSDAGSPSFSPDGTQVAYERFRKQVAVWIYTIATGKRRTLTRNGVSFAPVWGPNGIAFSRATGPGVHYDIWTIRYPGDRARRLTHTRAGIVPVAWSGDGSRLLAANPAIHNGRLWAVDAESGHARLLTDWTGDLFGQGLSSDGKTVLAAIGCGGRISPVGQVETLSFAGGPPHVILDGPCRASWND